MPTPDDLPDFLDLGPANDGHCVYALCWRNEVFYIGQTSGLFGRLRTHRANGVRFDQVLVRFCTRRDMDFLEQYLIRELQPRGNTHHTPKSGPGRLMGVLPRRKRVYDPSINRRI